MFEKQIKKIQDCKNSKFEITKKCAKRLKFYLWVNKLFNRKVKTK